MNIELTQYPVRVAGGTVPQALRLAQDVGGFSEIQLALSVYEGTDVEVRILTGMQTDSELGWVELGNFLVSNAGDSRSQVFYEPMRFIRWEVTSPREATVMIRGVARTRRAWLPRDMAGCILWLRSDLSVTLVGAGVSAWKDQSGKGNDASQSTSADRPAYQLNGWGGGLPALDFDGTTDFLALPTGMTSSSHSYTLVAAINQRNPTTNPQNLLSTDTITPARIFPSVVFTVNQPGIYDGAWKGCGSAAVAGEQTLTWVANAGTSGFACYRGGASIGTGAYGGTWSWTTPRIGKLATSQYFDGKLAELMLYDRALSSNDLEVVHGYLSARYG